MYYYHYDAEGRYIRKTPARKNPVNPDKYLGAPAGATLTKPSDSILNGEFIGVWDGAVWHKASNEDEALTKIYTEDQIKEAKKQKVLKAQADKLREMQAFYQRDANKPIEIGGVTYSGGQTSATKLDGQRRIYKEYVSKHDPSVTTVPFYDHFGDEHHVPIDSDTEIDAMDVTVQVSMAYSAVDFKMARIEKAILAAATIEEVEAIEWQTT